MRQGLPRTDKICKDSNVVSVADFIERAMAICERNRK